MPKRYRMTAATSWRALEYADKVLPKLGVIKRIKAFRHTSTQTCRWVDDGKPRKSPLMTSREYLLVVGENGSARFNGVCWGYGGTGPSTVHAILLKIGVDKVTADRLAFESQRLRHDGTSWEHHLTPATMV